MQKKTKRYYGMTVSQIGILAGMAAAICVLGAVFLFALMLPPSQTQRPPAALTPPTLAATSTLQARPSQTTTATPAGAVVPNSAPPEGWVQFQTLGATLWLPVNFVGGDLVNNRSETVNAITRLGRPFRNSVTAAREADREYVIWMVDKTIPKATDIITTVNVQHIIRTEEISLDAYIQEYLSNGDIEGTPVALLTTINETKRLTILGLEAKRLVTSTTYVGHDATGLTYYIKDGAEFWVINYYMRPNAYIDMLPVVEQSIQTFNLVK